MLSNCILLIVQYNCYQTSTLLVLLAVAKIINGTRMHSSRMRTVRCSGRLGRAGVPVSGLGRGSGGVEGCLWSQVEGCLPLVPPGQTPQAETPLGRPPRADDPAQCMLGYTPLCPVHAGIYTPIPSAYWDAPPTRGQTDACENISFPQLLLWTVNIGLNFIAVKGWVVLFQGRSARQSGAWLKSKRKKNLKFFSR